MADPDLGPIESRRIPRKLVYPVAQLLLSFVLYRLAILQLFNKVLEIQPSTGSGGFLLANTWDWTPLSIRVWSLLNAPLAPISIPHWGFNLYSSTRRTAILIGVLVLWYYVGWISDYKRDSRTSNPPIWVIGLSGLLAAWSLLAVIVAIHSVAFELLYLAVAALIWAVYLFWHFVLLLRARKRRSQFANPA